MGIKLALIISVEILLGGEEMEIKDSIAVVTGGASGLGEAVVRNIVKWDGKVVILDLDVMFQEVKPYQKN